MQKIHRLSGPAVVIGYIFLIPCVIGMLIGGFLMLGSILGASGVSGAMSNVVEKELNEAKIPQPIIKKVMSGTSLSDTDKKVLSAEQVVIVTDKENARAAGLVAAASGATLAVGMSLVLIVASFCGGLLGWILIMKKKVLRCSFCSATVNAS